MRPEEAGTGGLPGMGLTKTGWPRQLMASSLDLQADEGIVDAPIDGLFDGFGDGGGAMRLETRRVLDGATEGLAGVTTTPIFKKRPLAAASSFSKSTAGRTRHSLPNQLPVAIQVVAIWSRRQQQKT